MPIASLNPNLANLEGSGQSNSFAFNPSPDFPSYHQAEFERSLNLNFKKISYIDYTKFDIQQKNNFLYVNNRDFIDLTYEDRVVGFYETWSYYIESVPSQLEDAPISDVVTVTIEDISSIKPPLVTCKQVKETEIQLSISVDSNDKVEKVMIYKRPISEIYFTLLAETEILSDTVQYSDTDIEYSKSYIYRVFCQNIHGTISEPKEIKTFSSVQKVTPETRSNSLKYPIVSAVQDQNSDFVKITISPNDSNISYYEIKRKDLTIFEKKFAVPSKLETHFGGIGWPTNIFFVNKSRQSIMPSSVGALAALKTVTVMDEIIFVDDLVSRDHVYQYIVRGYDLFGNGSSHALAQVRVTGKRAIRTPINIKSETLRDFPFRVKISWDDDNLAALQTPEELFSGVSPVAVKPNKILYRVQRRRSGETSYVSFPLTANTFIVDEVPTVDAVMFDGTSVADTYKSLPNSELQNINVKLQNITKRPFNMPSFLVENDIYFYRIVALSDTREESNASFDFSVPAVADLSDPLSFKVEVTAVKVLPISVRLSWEVAPDKSLPDRWVIERKFDSKHDSFSVIGYAYLNAEFFDNNLQLGNTYVYRIKAFDSIGRESDYFETRLTV